jgi:hypothetical protein
MRNRASVLVKGRKIVNEKDKNKNNNIDKGKEALEAYKKAEKEITKRRFI